MKPACCFERREPARYDGIIGRVTACQKQLLTMTALPFDLAKRLYAVAKRRADDMPLMDVDPIYSIFSRSSDEFYVLRSFRQSGWNHAVAGNMRARSPVKVFRYLCQRSVGELRFVD